MKSIGINDLDKNSAKLERPAFKLANQKGASEASLLALLANSVRERISTLAAHSPLSLSAFLSFFICFPCRPSPPPLCCGKTTKGSTLSFHSGALMEARGLYTWDGPGGPLRVDLHLFNHPYFCYLKGEGGC